MQTITITNMSKVLKEQTVLNNISISLPKGQIYGFYGRNGSGKTMLFRAIAGLIIPTEGTIQVFDQVLGKDVSFPANLGLIIENVGFWPHLTGFENLKLLAMIQNKISDDDITNAIERVGLFEPKKPYRAYSLGMRQKLALAQAIMEKPDLLLLDEPMNSLDEQSVRSMYEVLREEKARGATILMCSHNKEDLANLCDEIYIMDTGRCTQADENFWEQKLRCAKCAGGAA